MKKLARKRINHGDLPARFTVFFDGACEPKNPGGTAGFGAVIFEGAGAHRVRVHDFSGMIPASPMTSNNVAEFLAVKSALDWFVAQGFQDEGIHFWGDSMLVISILWENPRTGGRWKIRGIDKQTFAKPGFYAEHAVTCREMLKAFPRCHGFWLPREENSIADDLSKMELRKAGVSFRIQPE